MGLLFSTMIIKYDDLPSCTFIWHESRSTEYLYTCTPLNGATPHCTMLIHWPKLIMVLNPSGPRLQRVWCCYVIIIHYFNCRLTSENKAAAMSNFIHVNCVCDRACFSNYIVFKLLLHCTYRCRNEKQYLSIGCGLSLCMTCCWIYAFYGCWWCVTVYVMYPPSPVLRTVKPH